MNSLQSSLYTVAIALCVFSTGIIRDGRRRTGRPVAWFTTFLVVETLALVFELLMVHPATPLKGLWLGLRIANSLLIAPCLWLAVKESVDGVRPTIAEVGRRSWIVIGAGVLLLLPLFATAHLGHDYANPESQPSRWHNRVIHGGMLLCVFIFAVQAPYYLWRCRQLLVAQFNRETHSAAATGDARSLAWLHLPLFVVLTTWLLGLLRTLQCAAHLPQELSLLFAATDVGVTVGAIYMIVRRANYSGLRPSAIGDESAGVAGASSDERAGNTPRDYAPPPRRAVAAAGDLSRVPARSTGIEGSAGEAGRGVASVPVSFAVTAQLNTVAVEVPHRAVESSVPAALRVPEASADSKYAKSPLDAAIRQRIVRKLETAMADEAVCCDSLISLRTLSQGIRENAHYVSQVINQEMGCTFYELLNRSRITLAKKRLLESLEQTVLEIALAVGFNSKSTFNAAFRRITRMTPTAFRARGSVDES